LRWGMISVSVPTDGLSELGVRRAKAALPSGCKSHPATAPIRAVMEVTKWLKPSISVSRIGDSASVQATTRVFLKVLNEL
jgi:hypothetical protein